MPTSSDPEGQGHRMGAVDPRYHVEAVSRAVRLLRLLAEEDAPTPLRALDQRLPWSKQTIYRLLRTLESNGAVRRVGDGFVPGGMMITIGQSALRALRVPEVARPHLRRLSEQTHETINLAVLEGREILYVDRVETKAMLVVHLEVGSRLPAHVTSLGHALLSDLPDAEVRRRLSAVKFTDGGPNAPRSLEDVLTSLDATRARGFAVNDEMLAVGQRGIATLIRDHTGTGIAAINISVPAARVSLDDLLSHAIQLMEAAKAISLDLGGS